MRVLITAGGTAEKIDQVRSITNHSTGRLGSLIAQAFLQKKAKVDYVTTAAAKKPQTSDLLTTYEISGTRDLADTLSHLLEDHAYDAVIHSMAVSDFTPAQSFSQEAFLSAINGLFQAKKAPLDKKDLAKLTVETKDHEKKISSGTEQLYLILEKTPKVIQLIKKLQPETILVGFKLLVDVPTEKLIQTAYQALQKNQADFVLANDLSQINAWQHIGYLIDRQGQIAGQAESKAEIAQLIVQTIYQQGGNTND